MTRAVAAAGLIACAFIARPLAQAPALAGWTTLETQHFRLMFPATPAVEPRVFADQAEASFAELTKFFDAKLAGRISFYVWNASKDAEPILGRPLGFANPQQMLIHASFDQTPGHELTHVLAHYAVAPERTTKFVNEGVAVAFDLSKRERLTAARDAVRRAPRWAGVASLWMNGGNDDALYPVAGALMQRLLDQGGKLRFLQLLARQTWEDARGIYGADLDRIVQSFEADLGMAPDSGTQANIDALRARAQERMRADLKTFSRAQLDEIEALYQPANRNMRAPGVAESLRTLLQKYPNSNRTGCALLYLAQLSSGAEREKYLKEAVEKHGDAWYGDGTQVASFGRALLAAHYQSAGDTTAAARYAEEIARDFPRAIEHGGALLTDGLRQMGLIK